MRTIALCVLMALVVAGCAAPPPAPVPVTADRLAGFQKGVTTEAQVVTLLGKPLTTSAGMDGSKILAYASVNTGVRGATFIPIVGLFAGGADMKMNSATFTFGQDGKLLDYRLSDTSYSVNALGQRQPARE